MLQRIGRNVFSLGISRIISGIILFVVYTRLVAYLGPHQYGKYALVLAYYTIFTLIMDLGISKFVTKKVSEEKAAASTYVGNYLMLQLLISLVVFGACVVIPKIFGYDQDVARSMLLIGIGLVIYSASLPFTSVVQAWQRLDVVAGITFVTSLLNSIWLALAIFLKQDVVFIFWVYVGVGAVNTLFYVWASRKMARPRLGWQGNIIKELFVFGPPFVLISGFEVLIQKVDSIIQKFFLPFAQIGQYSAAYRFLDFLTFIPAVVALTMFPFLAEARDLKRSDIEPILSRFNRYLMVFAVPIGVGGSVLSTRLITALFGREYLPAALPFAILIWAAVLTFIYAVPNVIMLVKRTRQMIAVLGVTTLFNALANWFFIPIYGIVGSAWITVISYVLVAGCYIYLAHRESYFKLFRYFWWPVVASTLMGLVATRFSFLNIFALVGLSAAVYFVILIAVGFLQKEDLVFLASIFRKEPGA
jgi:O-antigen/teichoic acid export membrane protein